MSEVGADRRIRLVVPVNRVAGLGSCHENQNLCNTRSRLEGETAYSGPHLAERRSVALDYSAAFFAAALRELVCFRAGAFVPALRSRPRDLASSERLAA